MSEQTTPVLSNLEVIRRLKWDVPGHFWWDPETGLNWSHNEVLLAHSIALDGLAADRKRLEKASTLLRLYAGGLLLDAGTSRTPTTGQLCAIAGWMERLAAALAKGKL